MSTIHLNNNNNNNVDETETSKISVPRISDFMEMKDEYYTQQLGNSKMPDYEQMSASYIKMVQWTLFYYYHDTCSWNHYYPYSCVPFVSDLVDVHKTTFNIEFDKPVEIFTHLLAILPTKSAHLLPKSYQLEMFDELKIPVCFFLRIFHKIYKMSCNLQFLVTNTNVEQNSVIFENKKKMFMSI